MANTIKLGTNGNWATKEGSLLAYNDENNNFKPLPFTTTRDTIATVVNKQGLIETVGSGIPRIDFSDDANGALLLEPFSRNLVTYSEDFTQTNWTTPNVTLVSDNGISPEGTSNADLIYPNATDANFTYVYDQVNNASVSQYTISAFVKSSGVNVAWLYIQSVGSVGSVYFDLSDESIQIVNGSSNTLTSEITSLGNGWYRISCTNVTPIALTSGHGIGISDAKGSRAITKNGTNGMLIYGAQIEQQSYATSYIKNAGTALGVTRSADTASASGNSTVINSTEGVLYAEIKGFENDLSNKYISLSDGSSSNSIRIFYYNDGSTVFFRKAANSVNVITSSTSTINQSSLTKIAVRYDSTSFDIFSNGVKILTNSNSDAFTSPLNDISFNSSGSSTFYGKTKDLRVYNTALSDSELAILTTI